MKLTTISYQRTYNLGNYSSERIGFEASIDDAEDEQKALLKLKELADKFHKENNPQMYYDDIGNGGVSLPTDYLKVSNIEIIEPKEQRIGVLASEILSCNSLKILETYRFLKDTKPELKEAYEKRKIELENQK